MVKAILESRWTTIILSSFLLLILLFGYSIAHFIVSAQSDNQSDTNNSSTNVVYLVPANLELVEEELSPATLFSNQALMNQYEITVQAISDWNTVEHMANDKSLKVLIIHYKAQDLVNEEEIKQLFQEQSVVVAGIGIPGLTLAELVGHPSIFTSTWPSDEGYTTPYYFYVYSLNIEGDESELETLEANGWQIGEEPSSETPVRQPLMVSYGATTDSLLASGKTSTLLNVIHSYILDVNEQEKPVQPQGSE
jgi:hypothetical protein